MIVTKDREIIITDPCYFAKNMDWGCRDGLGFDFEEYKINLPQFSNYIWLGTGFGDGSGVVLEAPKPQSQYELEEKIIELDKSGNIDNDPLFKKIGKFGVDSGTFGAFFYDEVLKYNPDFAIEVGSWCYTILRDFEGTLYSTTIDDTDEGSEYNFCFNCLVGSGNKSVISLW
jgi:hypothetical protein